MKYIKPLLFTLGYVLLFCLLPIFIWVESGTDSTVGLFIYFLATIFATLGFMLFYTLFRNDAPKAPKVNNELKEKLDNIEIQNAAIAFSLSEVKKAVKGKDDFQ